MFFPVAKKFTKYQKEYINPLLRLNTKILLVRITKKKNLKNFSATVKLQMTKLLTNAGLF